MELEKEQVKLTQYSHGAGCGCKISPKILDEILKSVGKQNIFPNLLVGNETKDDAAVYDLGNGKCKCYKRCICHGRKTFNGNSNFRMAN